MKRNQSGFTITELIVVLSILCILQLLLLPALCRTNSSSSSIVCANNLRRLTASWSMYSADNKERICRTGGMDVVVTDPNAFDAKGAKANWVLGSVTDVAKGTNIGFITNGLLYNYVKDTRCYKCPADSRTVAFPNTSGLPTIRSYSANCWMNPINSWNASLRSFRKQDQVVKPGTTLLFVDENPGSIDEGWFVVDLDPRWISIPATHHEGASGLSFCDGRVEFRHWRDKAILGNITSVGANPRDPGDLQWVQARSTY